MKALITGVTGQTGSYLAEQLLDSSVEVFGAVRSARPAPDGVVRVSADLLDQASLEAVLRFVQPDEIYHLAAVTAPGGAWGTEQPPLLADVTAVGTVRLLDAITRTCPDARVVCASSSAIFDPHRYGLYGISKRFAHDAAVGYRKQLRVSNAVLYSHMSPRQDPRFLAPAIAATIGRIRRGSQEKLLLSDIDAARDWGWAPDFAQALAVICESEPGDYTVATGGQRTVRQYVSHCLMHAGLAWPDVVERRQAPPAPVEAPADISAITALGWQSTTTLSEMTRHMVEAVL